ncbi:hypothetical protein QGX17_gp051 [Pseudomonas phage phiPsa381]|uniref:Uncharacterized protein n=1 Tax=Pseudomonas phage phiPsa381 TaxID=1460366 RepID=A0A7G9V302_9CAUD|nr:hypothetical protein QGX17_gp051 [Pseudomonas phage phiPsa381]QNO00658.1 hypothetical protein phiPsa381_173 [Pseudomonas phage phiPsa381]
MAISTIAVMFTACTYAACNTYAIDTADSSRDCMTNLVAHSESFANVWAITTTPKPLQAWLDKFNVSEDAPLLTDYDFTCEPIHTDDTP